MSKEKSGKELENFSDQIRQLSYTGHNLQTIPGFLISKNADQVKQLNLSHNDLQCLGGLDSFYNLEELTLDNNSIDDATTFPHITTLCTLSLNNNKLTILARLITKLRKSFPSLNYLSLLGNRACPNELLGHTMEEYQKYRCYVSSHLPNLRFLDWKAVSNAERKKGCEIFNLPTPLDLYSQPGKNSMYSPLPKTEDPVFADDNKAVVGTIRYKYVGKKSEGNRFIKNKDL